MTSSSASLARCFLPPMWLCRLLMPVAVTWQAVQVSLAAPELVSQV